MASDIIARALALKANLTSPKTLTQEEQEQVIENVGGLDLEITYDDNTTATLTVAGFVASV